MKIFFGLCFIISRHNSLPIDPPPPVTKIFLLKILFFKIFLSTLIFDLSIISKKSILGESI